MIQFHKKGFLLKTLQIRFLDADHASRRPDLRTDQFEYGPGYSPRQGDTR